MSALQKTDLYKNIADLLLQGKTTEDICSHLQCESDDVQGVLCSEDFSIAALQVIENKVKSLSLPALHNIEEIAKDKKISPATRLKANTFLVEKALEFKALGHGDKTPSTMSQDELVKRLDELHSEAAKRAKPIKSVEDKPSLEDML